MPTTFFAFQPEPTGIPFQFQPELDGAPYLAQVKWNTWGQRWYIALSAPNGTLIFNQAVVGSQPVIQLQTLTWDNGWATLKALIPHTFRAGDTADITVRGCDPPAYNGLRRVHALDLFRLTYRLPEPPGMIVQLGLASYDINLAGGYFKQSTLIFRPGTQQFEVFTPP